MGATRRDYLGRVRLVARSFAARPAFEVVRADGKETWTHAEIWGAVCAAADRLTSEGLRPGDRVGILGPTLPEWAVAELAVFHTGAVAVPLEPQHPDGVLEAILGDSGSRLVLAGPEEAERARGLRISGEPPRVTGFDELIDLRGHAGRDAEPAAVRDEDPRLLVYTSGTTGTPKGVTLTEGNIRSELDAILQVVPVGREDVVLSILPFSHIYAQVVNLLGPILIGASVRFAEEPAPQAVRRALGLGGVTAFGAVPQFFALFRDRIRAEVTARGAWTRRAIAALEGLSRTVRAATGWNPGRLLFGPVHRAFGGRLRWIISAGSHLDPDLARQYETWGFHLLCAYGLTECSAAVTVTPPDDCDPTTVGRPLPGVEVRIDRPGQGGVGEVLVRGPVVMKGYWNRPEETARVIDRDGWFHTGDLGRFDTRGNLVLTGRLKEMIPLPSGKNVYPEELDAHYESHPLLKEVCVVGLPAEGGGERLHAVIVPDLEEARRQGLSGVNEAIRWEVENLGLGLPGWQRVRTFSVSLEPLPRTPTRKVQRLEVRQRLLEGEIALEARAPRRAFTWSPEDEARLETPAVRSIVTLGRLEGRREGRLHPEMSLEFDLGIDSLERAELVALLSAELGHPLEPEKSAAALTLGELADLVDAVREGAGEGPAPKGGWGELLDDPDARAEARQLIPPIRGARSLVPRAICWLARATGRLYGRMTVVGVENLPRRQRPFLIAPNHLSFADPFLVAGVLPWIVARDSCYLGYSSYFSGGVLGWIARRLNVVPVDESTHLLRALRLGRASLGLGRVLVVFPEGERSLHGRLREFKKGTALLVRHARVPVVPTAILGTHEMWPRGRRFPRPGRITIAFGPPLDFPSSFTSDAEADVERINGELRRAIADLIRVHGGPPPETEPAQ